MAHESIKEEMVWEAIKCIHTVAMKTFANQGIKFKNEDEYLLNFVGLNGAQQYSVIFFIMNYLPSTIYIKKFENVRNYFQLRLIQQLILFLVQEDVNSKFFQLNLVNFKDEIIGELVNAVYVADK